MIRSVVERYYRAQWPYQPEALAELRHPDWVMEWPQSGERIRGHDNDRAINEAYPGYPRHEVLSVAGKDEAWALSPSAVPVRVSGAGDVWFGELFLEYPNGERFFNVGVTELRDGKIVRDTVYWAPQIEGPAWRAQWVERMDRPLEEEIVSAVGTPADERANLELAERFVAREAEGDIVGAMREFWSQDAVEEIPQTGERIRGLDRAVSVIEAHPELPTVRPRRITASGDLVVMELELRYGDDPWFAFEVARFSGGKLVRAVEYFGQPFEAPEWRAPWVERF